MDIIQIVIKALLAGGLIFVILNNAIKNIKTKKKIFTNLFVGFVLIAVFLIAFFVDFQGVINKKNIAILIYSGSMFLFPLIYILSYLNMLKGGVFSSTRNHESRIYFKDYLYIIYKEGNNIYLKTDKKGNHSGIIIRGKKNKFLEDVLYNFNKSVGIDSTQNNKIGKIEISKKKLIYHCYYVETTKAPNYSNIIKINKFQSNQYQMNGLDKEIVYRMIVNERFDVKR